MNNYVVYHLHDEMSLLDSVTKFTDYVDMAIENNMKAIACTNHGNIYHWIERVLYCQEKGIKYLHGCGQHNFQYYFVHMNKPVCSIFCNYIFRFCLTTKIFAKENAAKYKHSFNYKRP